MNIFTQKIGVTRSLKAILQPINTDADNLAEITLDFTLADHFDAYALYQYLMARELATVGRDSPRLELYDEVGFFHSNRLGYEEIQSQMEILALATIFEVIEFGKGRADPIFV